MRDNFLSITGGIFGAFVGAELMQVAIQVTGTIMLAFIGGIAGALGKKFFDYMTDKKRRK